MRALQTRAIVLIQSVLSRQACVPPRQKFWTNSGQWAVLDPFGGSLGSFRLEFSLFLREMRPITEEKREHVYSEAPLEPESSQGGQETRQKGKQCTFWGTFLGAIFSCFSKKNTCFRILQGMQATAKQRPDKKRKTMISGTANMRRCV